MNKHSSSLESQMKYLLSKFLSNIIELDGDQHDSPLIIFVETRYEWTFFFYNTDWHLLVQLSRMRIAWVHLIGVWSRYGLGTESSNSTVAYSAKYFHHLFVIFRIYINIGRSSRYCLAHNAWKCGYNSHKLQFF